MRSPKGNNWTYYWTYTILQGKKCSFSLGTYSGTQIVPPLATSIPAPPVQPSPPSEKLRLQCLSCAKWWAPWSFECHVSFRAGRFQDRQIRNTHAIFMLSFLNSFSHVVSCCVIAVQFSPLLVFRNGEMEQHLVNEMLLPPEDGARWVKTNYILGLQASIWCFKTFSFNATQKERCILLHPVAFSSKPQAWPS